MTAFERKQSSRVTIGTGYKAYRMGILRRDNPYAKTEREKLWFIGYDKAAREDRK
jgi:hypothetical protein